MVAYTLTYTAGSLKTMPSKKVIHPTFSERVVQLALLIPPGKVTTYGRIAIAAGGGPMASQSITTILGKAAMQGEAGIPFHRIVYADGRVWMDAMHKAKRITLYKKEGISLTNKGIIANFIDTLFEFK
jgi:methylated-DNA-protein-cysteine methyltransferase-like protein